MPFSNENQNLFIEKLSRYLSLAAQKRPTVYHNNDATTLLNRLRSGLCSGAVALWFYHKHTGKEQYFYNSLMIPILTWDGREKTLSKELEEIMEYALSASVSLQGDVISGMTAYIQTPFEQSMIQQTDYQVLIRLLKEDHYPNLRKEYEIAFVFKNEEFQSLLEEFLPGKLIRLSSSDHAIGLFFDGQTYVLFDSNGFLDEQTKERFFEKRFAANDLKYLIKNIQSAFYTSQDSNITGLTISVFDDVDKPMPIYTDRVKKIRNILYNRRTHGGTMDLDASNPYDNASALWFCASRGHLDVVKLLLARGATYQIKKDLIGPIHLAAQNSHFDILELLLDSSIGLQFIDTPTKSGHSPLYFAAEKNHIKIVKLLLNKGAKLEASVVHIAAQQGYSDVLQLLLNTQPQLIDIPMENGFTSLYIAVQNNHVEVVRLLLRKGANIYIKNKNSVNAMHIAAQQGYSAILELLLDSSMGLELIDMPTRSGASPLYLAAKAGKTETVKLLLHKGASIYIGNKNSINAIHLAAEEGYSAVLELLLDSRIGSQLIDTPMENGLSPLYLAAMLGQTEAVRVLLRKGAKIDIGNKSSENAIHLAAEQGHSAVLELLLDSRIGSELIDTPTHNGASPLYLAAMLGKTEAVRVLLGKGASIDIRNKSSENALHLAAEQGHCAVLELLLNSITGSQLIYTPTHSGAAPLYLAAQNGHFNAVELLLSRGAEIDETENNGLNSIHIAAQNGHINVLRLLLNSNIEEQLLNTQIKDGTTPLYLAAANGHLEIVKLLLNHGAKVHIADPTNVVLKNGREDIFVLLQQAKLQQENPKEVQKNIIPMSEIPSTNVASSIPISSNSSTESKRPATAHVTETINTPPRPKN